MKTFGAIEAGGTKWVCGIGTGPDDLERVQFPTTTPEETIGAAIAYFSSRNIAALGIGSFGPVDLTRGRITSTPKAFWQNTDVAGPMRAALGIPVGFDTDVNAAALGESKWGAAQGVSSCIYLTVGTGVGGGAIVNGHLLHGAMHPEMGHIKLPTADSFAGNCPFHGDCLEGVAAGPAIERRWGVPSTQLPPGHPAWAMEARYLALAIANFSYVLSPEVVILGGGVMQQAHLFPMIRSELEAILNNYIAAPAVLPPKLGTSSGVLGALALAQAAL
ncbi:MAG: ROK family protein [Acidobacteriota bacterium]|nr:ROK family protein [Acidobacteriota bacterium]